MTYPAYEGDAPISRAHIAALSQEIAERLGADLHQTAVPMPAHLIRLMTRLRDEASGIQPAPSR